MNYIFRKWKHVIISKIQKNDKQIDKFTNTISIIDAVIYCNIVRDFNIYFVPNL